MTQPAQIDMPKYVTPALMKGDKGGQCNRMNCANIPAIYNHSGTRRYYCVDCARKINAAANKKLCVFDNPTALT